MKIGQILQEKQPEEYRKLNKKKERKAKEHLSFDYIDRLMRERTDVDSTRCRGR